MSYTCRITNAVKDATGDNANIVATLVVTDDASSDVVMTKVITTNGMDANQLKAFAQGLIAQLLIRDGFYPVIKAAADNQFILAQG